MDMRVLWTVITLSVVSLSSALLCTISPRKWSNGACCKIGCCSGGSNVDDSSINNNFNVEVFDPKAPFSEDQPNFRKGHAGYIEDENGPMFIGTHRIGEDPERDQVLHVLKRTIAHTLVRSQITTFNDPIVLQVPRGRVRVPGNPEATREVSYFSVFLALATSSEYSERWINKGERGRESV